VLSVSIVHLLLRIFH